MTATTDDDAHAGLTCPLCRYDLRGLVDPRCPECGHRFTWAELTDARRLRHPYLFEHAAGRRVRGFWLTYWRTWRPRRFWQDLTPTHPIRLRWLVAYGLLAAAVLLAVPIGTFGTAAVDAWQAVRVQRSNMYVPIPGRPGWFTPRGQPNYSVSQATLDQDMPMPYMAAFWSEVLRASTGVRRSFWSGVPWLTLSCVVAAWPWLSWVALLVFRRSMRGAGVDPAHVLRVAVYGCDFGFATGVTIGVRTGLLSWWTDNLNGSDHWAWAWLRVNSPDFRYRVAIIVTGIVLGCAALVTVRMSVAYARYMRFDRPVATVLASQVMAVLLVLTILTVTGQLL